MHTTHGAQPLDAYYTWSTAAGCILHMEHSRCPHRTRPKNASQEKDSPPKEDALPANKSPASQSDFAALKSVKSCAGMVQSVVVSSAAHLDLAALSVKSEIVVPVG